MRGGGVFLFHLFARKTQLCESWDVNERKIVDIFVSNIMTWLYNGRVNHFYGDENIATSECLLKNDENDLQIY